MTSMLYPFYKLDIIRKTVCCLVFNQSMVDSFVFFFECTEVGRVSDSMKEPT